MKNKKYKATALVVTEKRLMCIYNKEDLRMREKVY